MFLCVSPCVLIENSKMKASNNQVLENLDNNTNRIQMNKQAIFTFKANYY